MSNPEAEWKDSAVLIYVVVSIITLAIFIMAFAWAIINNPNMRLQLKKICCCLHDSMNKYDSIVQDDAEGHELIDTNKDKVEEVTYEIEEEQIVADDGDEIEINLGLDNLEDSAI